MTHAPSTKKTKINLEHDSQVLRIVLASPPGNILDGKTMAEIVTALDFHKSNNDIKAIIFEGEGKHFCFGASVEEHRKEHAAEMIFAFHNMFKKLLSFGSPLIALVRGQCLGGGMELASFCNFIIAEPSAMFGQPEIQLAVLPPVAAVILPGIIGQLRADDLVLTGRSIDAHTAMQWGLVNQVADDGQSALDDFLKKHILPKSAEALRHANHAVRREWFEQLSDKLDRMQHAYVNDLMNSADANEGIGAFLEKRKPQWKNR